MKQYENKVFAWYIVVIFDVHWGYKKEKDSPSGNQTHEHAGKRFVV